MKRKPEPEEEAPVINQVLEVYASNLSYLEKIAEDGGADPDSTLTAFSVAKRSVKELKKIAERCKKLGIDPVYDIDSLVESHNEYADKLQKQFGISSQPPLCLQSSAAPASSERPAYRRTSHP
jgi:diphthamide synthase (EF-2-diphthine--ammonia ligase)